GDAGAVVGTEAKARHDVLAGGEAGLGKVEQATRDRVRVDLGRGQAVGEKVAGKGGAGDRKRPSGPGTVNGVDHVGGSVAQGDLDLFHGHFRTAVEDLDAIGGGETEEAHAEGTAGAIRAARGIAGRQAGVGLASGISGEAADYGIERVEGAGGVAAQR